MRELPGPVRNGVLQQHTLPPQHTELHGAGAKLCPGMKAETQWQAAASVTQLVPVRLFSKLNNMFSDTSI